MVAPAACGRIRLEVGTDRTLNCRCFFICFDDNPSQWTASRIQAIGNIDRAGAAGCIYDPVVTPGNTWIDLWPEVAGSCFTAFDIAIGIRGSCCVAAESPDTVYISIGGWIFRSHIRTEQTNYLVVGIRDIGQRNRNAIAAVVKIADSEFVFVVACAVRVVPGVRAWPRDIDTGSITFTIDKAYDRAADLVACGWDVRTVPVRTVSPVRTDQLAASEYLVARVFGELYRDRFVSGKNLAGNDRQQHHC